jgi:hypothetical protein
VGDPEVIPWRRTDGWLGAMSELPQVKLDLDRMVDTR